MEGQRHRTQRLPLTNSALGGARSGAVHRRVLAAVLHELVDQQRILPEVQVDIAGEQVWRYKALVADDVALGILHLIGGLEAAVVPGDAAPVKLVPAVELAAR